jgi:hypothetical protein
MIEHNYPLYIAVWFVISILTLIVFRLIPKKMKETRDKQTKSSLFTIMIVIGLPLLMAAVLGPLIFLIGDKNMDSAYRYTWYGLLFIFVIYFFIKQRSPKH